MGRKRVVRAGLLVALAAFAVYMASFRTIATVDVVSNVLLAYSIARDRDLYLDEFVADDDRLSFYRISRGDRALPVFPWGAPLFAAPFAALGDAVGISPPDVRSVTVIGKLAAATAAAISVFFVFLLSARIAGRRLAIVTASLYAFGTATWPVSGGGLWQHGPAQALLAAMLYVLWPARTRASPVRAGLLGSAAALVRVQDAAFTAAAGAYLGGRRLLTPFLVASLPAVAAYIGVSLFLYGSLLSPQYGTFYRSGEAVVGVLGNLVSPSRGIFVLSPFLILAAYALVRRCRGSDAVAVLLRWQLAAAAVVLIAHGSYVDWLGGHTYGNRYLADTLPLLAAGLALWLRRHHRSAPARWLLVSLAAPAVVVAAIGALLYDQSWSWEALDSDHPRLMWQLDRWQPLYTAVNAGPYLDGVTLLSLTLIAAAWAGLAVMFLRASFSHLGPRG